MQSAPTARRRIIPLITICIYELMFIRTIPLLNTPIIRTPAMTFDIFPDPPFTLTPPSTTHVITSNSYPTPAFGCAVLARASITKPAIINPNFLTVKNLLNVAKQVSIFGIASVGMTYVILLGGIDLATGSIISFVNIVCAYFMVNIGMNVVLAVLLSLIISTFIGFLNGIIIAELRMPALIVTFASQTIFAGYAYIICGGVPISRMPESFLKLGQGYVGPIPVPVIVMVVIFAIGTFILNKTYFGRYFYALGGNEEAALLSGIKIKVVKCLVYSLSGLFAGIVKKMTISTRKA